eukprot:975067_1
MQKFDRKYVRASDIDANLCFQFVEKEGTRIDDTNLDIDSLREENSGSVSVSQLWVNGERVSLPVSTFSKHIRCSCCVKTPWCSFPLKAKDLICDAKVVVQLQDLRSQPINENSGEVLISANSSLLSGKTERCVLNMDDTKLANKRKPGKYSHWADSLLSVRLQHQDGIENVHPSLPSHSTIAKFPKSPYPVVVQESESQYALSGHPRQNQVGARCMVNDPEISRENPIELKRHKLGRSHNDFISEKNAKPSVDERKKLTEILISPSKVLKQSEKRLLWKFRYTLVDDKHALTKFLRAVDWKDSYETKQALSLLEKWDDVDIADALELLSSYFSNQQVRLHGIRALARADDDEFSCYLLPLVQALRFEKEFPNQLSEFLETRVLESFNLCNFYFWYSHSVTGEKSYGEMYQSVLQSFVRFLEKSEVGITFLLEIRKQEKLVEDLLQLNLACRQSNRRIDKKIEKLRWFLKNDPKFSHLQKINEALKMPVRPDLSVSGIIPEKASMFKSALSPLNLTFQTLDPSSMYKVIFKSGDDLSQDQMIINIIKLMDRLLKRVNLDLKLTPYNVLATSENDGFVDFVPESFTITSILEKFDNSIIEFLKFYNDTPTAFGDSLDSFVKSCAGYCVITYLLAIGDRHLDNLLVTKSGRLFHIDFGFVFGNDPKPFPPPMKLCKEMVEAMGQSDSVHYHKF